MFVGRERELDMLRRRYRSDVFEFVGIYGRRRVGKTSLINEFAHKLPCGYLTAVEDDPKLNLRGLSQAVYALAHPDADPDLAPTYNDFQAALEAAFALARSKRLLLVIDEFPYLAKAVPSFPSILQASIDRHAHSSQLYLILCGSSLSFMKEQLFGDKSPLYGRRTAQLELKPFDYFDALRLLPGIDPVDALHLYASVGGIPHYLRQFRPDASVRANISQAFMNPDALLYEEPTNLLKQEVTKAAPYNAVLAAIAGGSSQHNEIATAAGIESGGVDYYLKELMRIGLISRERPIVRPGRRSIYRITDGLYRFWYRYVRPRRSLVEHGLGDTAADAIVSTLPEFSGSVFEQVCKDWLWRRLASGDATIVFDELGRWWGADQRAHSQAELDVVALTDGSVSAVGECKWGTAPAGERELRRLDERAVLVGADAGVARLMFSRSGFTDGCDRFARCLPLARLISLAEMLATEPHG